MLSSYNVTSQTVPVNGTLNFTTDRILTGCTATRNGQTFQLNKPGYYYVTFNASASTSDTAGIVTVQLNNGGQIVPGAIASFNSEATADTENISFSTNINDFRIFYWNNCNFDYIFIFSNTYTDKFIK